MRLTRSACPPVGLSARLSFATALVAAVASSPNRPRRAPNPRVFPRNASLHRLPDERRTQSSPPSAVDGKRCCLGEYSRASPRVSDGEAARGHRDPRHGRSRAQTDGEIRMRAARLAAHRRRLHQVARLRAQRQPLRAGGFRRLLPRRLPRVAGRALSRSPMQSASLSNLDGGYPRAPTWAVSAPSDPARLRLGHTLNAAARTCGNGSLLSHVRFAGRSTSTGRRHRESARTQR
jgi:hypothetical protein